MKEETKINIFSLNDIKRIMNRHRSDKGRDSNGIQNLSIGRELWMIMMMNVNTKYIMTKVYYT